jgi:hypothetical protein
MVDCRKNTILQFSSACGSASSSIRTISSTGSACQGMMSSGKEQVGLAILSYLIIQVIGVRLDEPRRRERVARARSLAHTTMTPNGKVKIPTKVPLPALQLSHLSYFISESSIKKISYNAIILALTVLFWCVTVSLPLPLDLSLWSYRDAGTTQMTRHPHKISMTH